MVTVNSNGTTQVPLKSRSRSFRAGTNTATRNTCHMLSPPSQSLPPPTSLPARNAENTRVALRIVGSRAQAGFVIRLKGSRRLYLFLQTASMAPHMRAARITVHPCVRMGGVACPRARIFLVWRARDCALICKVARLWCARLPARPVFCMPALCAFATLSPKYHVCVMSLHFVPLPWAFPLASFLCMFLIFGRA